MKKVLLSSFLLSSIVVAQDNTVMQNGVFAGVEIGKTKVTASAEGISIDSKNENSFAIKFGQEKDDYRIYGKYLNCDFDGDAVHVLSLNYDKFFNLEQMRPFVGATIGYLTYSENEDVDIDLSGLTYGLNLGISKDLSNNLSAEVGFNYIFTTATDDIKEGRQNIILDLIAIEHSILG